MSSTSDNSLVDANFVVVDVETTGMSGSANRITEIACVVVRDSEIRHTFTSLVNPRQFIPPFIESLTGITNLMVHGAPEEPDVMRTVHDLLRLPNAVFVAHNASFDWSFVSQALLRCGLDTPPVPLLCTCKLANRLLPKKQKRNLGSVAQHFGIRIDGRHRAYGDAHATAHVLIEFLEQLENEHDVVDVSDVVSFQNKRLSSFRTTPKLIRKIQPLLDSLPGSPGVYYMIDSQGSVMYVGKAKSLNERVRSYFHLSAQLPKKIASMVRRVESIRWEETGSELAALLFESREIKRLKPPFNTLSKKIRRYPFLRLTTSNDYPIVEFCDSIDDDGAEYYGPFLYRGMVHDVVETITRNFKLRRCSHDLAPSEQTRPCFYHHIHRCDAPCAALQSREQYRAEVDAVRRFLTGYSEGVISMLEIEMQACAERLDFEQAAMLRNRIRELRTVFERRHEGSTAVNRANILVVVPVSSRDRTVEVFCLRQGLLVHQQILGRKADLSSLFEAVERYFYREQNIVVDFSPEDIDQLRIVTQWVYRRRHDSFSLLVEEQDFSELKEQVTEVIRNAFNVDQDFPSSHIDQLSAVDSNSELLS